MRLPLQITTEVGQASSTVKSLSTNVIWSDCSTQESKTGWKCWRVYIMRFCILHLNLIVLPASYQIVFSDPWSSSSSKRIPGWASWFCHVELPKFNNWAISSYVPRQNKEHVMIYRFSICSILVSLTSNKLWSLRSSRFARFLIKTFISKKLSNQQK